MIDFEDLQYRDELTGTSYRGLTWEEGTGTFDDDVRAIDQPLTTGDEDETQHRTEELHKPAGGGTAPNLLQSFKGAQLFDNGANYIPPDTCGAIAPNHFVEVVNTNLSIYDRVTQNRVVNVNLTSIWGTFAGDPRAGWDHLSNRMFLLATDFSSRIYIAVSLTSDPTGAYFATSFLTNGGSDAG